MIKHTALFGSLMTLILLQTACSSKELPAVPAVITNPSAETRLELQQAIQSIIGGEPAKLADNALTTSSQLYIEYGVMTDDKHRPMTGRRLLTPFLFLLQQKGQQCLLRNEETGKEVQLTQIRCKPASH